MRILEHGQEQSRTLLFFPCTAEPVWAFEDTIALLSRKWHVFQVVYDGHQPEYPGDFTSVEQTVEEVCQFLRERGVSRLDAAYGCPSGPRRWIQSSPIGMGMMRKWTESGISGLSSVTFPKYGFMGFQRWPMGSW